MKTNKITGNKGEWSEMYAFLKLLGERRIYGADGDLNIRYDVYYDLNKIIREETKGKEIEYVVNEDLKTIDVIAEGEVKVRFKFERYAEEAEYLFGQICSRKGSFTVERTVEFMEKICSTKLKAPSKDKIDIVVGIPDKKTGMDSTLGFSIKSNLGHPPTLLNASTATNFIFKLNGATDEDASNINSIVALRSKGEETKEHPDLKGRAEYILKKGIEMEFIDTQSKEFRSNLTILDSLMPEILAETLKDFFLTGENSVEKLAVKLTDTNPIGYDMTGSNIFYRQKIKKFLSEIATGMVPGTYWSGRKDATGGYFVVKETGEIVCYHLYNLDDFEEYLLKNTYLDKPSTGRHGYGIAEKAPDGKYTFKLNLQIRFKGS